MTAAERFTQARQSRDYSSARALLGSDPRSWWGERTGPGDPWNIEGGRWSEWDRHFRGNATHGPWTWHESDRSASAEFFESNDYFTLLEGRGTRFRVTYFFDDRGFIIGRLIAGIEEEPGLRGREADFEVWAAKHHPVEWNYLRPGGQIDPTGDRPSRTRVLLNSWRIEANLPAR